MALRVAVGLGSNLGSPEERLLAAASALERVPGLVPVALSSGFETDPVGTGGPRFLNAAILLRTALSAREVLAALQGVEAALGRRRGAARWEPRPIDLDLLLYGKEIIDEAPRLRVPHPRLRERAFALAPLVEVWPAARDPERGDRYAAVLAGLDRSGVDPPRPLPRRVPRRALEHTADVGFEVTGPSAEAVFEGAAMALVDLLVRRDRVRERERRVVEARGADREELLVGLLSELLFLVDGAGFAPRRATLISLEPGRARAAVHGERLHDGSQLRSAVKAVTYHGAAVDERGAGGRCRARVYLDV